MFMKQRSPNPINDEVPLYLETLLTLVVKDIYVVQSGPCPVEMTTVTYTYWYCSSRKDL